VTAKTITVGIMYSTNGDAANAAIGAAGLTQGDTLADAKALVADVNAHGGIAGRKLVAVYHATNAQSQDPRATQDQAACTDFTQDHKVMAVFGSNFTDTLPSCLRKAGVVFMKAGVILGEDSTYLRQFSNEILLGTLAQERALRDQVGSFVRQGWFGGWNVVSGAPAKVPVKVGVITFDEPTYHRSLRGTLLPALRAAGHPAPETDVFEIHTPTSSSDQAGSIAQLKSATLRLQQDGVTHVVLVDTSGGILELFASNARTQGYYPRLGLSSGDGVQAIHDTGLVQDKQLVGMAGNGWLPFLDLPAADGSRYATAATKRCLKIMKDRTGQTYTSTNAASLALSYCDQVFLFTQALRSAHSLSPAGLVEAIGAIGSSYASPVLPRAYFSPTRHDEGVQAWDMNWVSSCSCVRYSSPHDVT
jgi:ABC-type branched-subunit amino acid transport system substrate-binding protein